MECGFKDIAEWHQICSFFFLHYVHYELQFHSVVDFLFYSCFGISAVKLQKLDFFTIKFVCSSKLWFCELDTHLKSIIMTYWWWYPPTYYNHFIEHPILWSNERKRWEQQRLSNECYSVWKTQERIKRSEKLKNQSEVWKPQNNKK